MTNFPQIILPSLGLLVSMLDMIILMNSSVILSSVRIRAFPCDLQWQKHIFKKRWGLGRILPMIGVNMKKEAAGQKRETVGSQSSFCYAERGSRNMEAKNTGLRVKILGTNPNEATHYLCKHQQIVVLHQCVGDNSILILGLLRILKKMLMKLKLWDLSLAQAL